jgi:hypothetical protein
VGPAALRITSTRSSSPGMVTQSSPASSRFNGPAVGPQVASPFAAPLASSRLPMPQTYFSQPARGFGGISRVPPPAPVAPFSLPGIFQPYLGEVPTIGKTFPSFFPSSIPIKTPAAACTIIDDLAVPDPQLKNSGPLISSGPSNSRPTESKRF